MSRAPRTTYFQLAPRAFNNLSNLSNDLHRDLLGAGLVDLVLLRASQISGCTFCIGMHWAGFIKMSKDLRHLNVMAGWHGAPFFTGRGYGAALCWAELVTNTPHSDAGNEEFARLHEYFSDEEIVELSFVIVTTSNWNLLNVNLHNPVPLKALRVTAA